MKTINTLLSALLLAAAVPASAQSYAVAVNESQEPMKTGKFEPTWESLMQYETPEWFRDAKFGIWAHWGPQCVEGSGDWMARTMYIEDSYQYKHHLEHYGHPSEVGFKDIIPLFKAEKWNPDSLVGLYKRVGAQYFFVMGNHHDNFDLWDSKYQPWNSQNMGPKRDVIGEWAAAAKKYDLPLGISFHADHAWSWYEPAQRYDRKGPKSGVPYDGCLTKEDGKGKWWEGYDPQMLYAQNHPLSRASWADYGIHGQWAWENGVTLPSEDFVTNFYNRTLDAINRYKPELIYFDATVLPFYPISDAGLRIVSHLYNSNMADNGGKLSAVAFAKILDEKQRQALVWDVERGAPNELLPLPWQMCNCLGNWHYDTGVYEGNRYKSAAHVVKLLVDIVSKNGNMLLSVPLRADGTLDEKEMAILEDLAAWMDVNKECIFGTRPWTIFGEGPVSESAVQMNGPGFNDGTYADMGASEIRFTQTPRYLYATAMAWPEDHKLTIKSLAKGSKLHTGKIKDVQLLGYGKVKFTSTPEGLEVYLPDEPTNRIAPVIRIRK